MFGISRGRITILVGEPGRKGPLVMPRCRFQGYIKKDVKEKGG
jgi:hypothetical protein